MSEPAKISSNPNHETRHAKFSWIMLSVALALVIGAVAEKKKRIAKPTRSREGLAGTARAAVEKWLEGGRSRPSRRKKRTQSRL